MAMSSRRPEQQCFAQELDLLRFVTVEPLVIWVKIKDLDHRLENRVIF